MRPEPVSVVSGAPATGSEQRGAERFGVGLPYTIAGQHGQHGQTLDLSATGLSFESDIQYPVGALVQLTLRYGLDGHNFPLPCQVEVVRIEPHGGGFTVAARLCRPFFDLTP